MPTPRYTVHVVLCVPVKVEGIAARSPKKAIEAALESAIVQQTIRELEAQDHIGDIEEQSHFFTMRENNENTATLWNSSHDPLIDSVLKPLVKWYDSEDGDDDLLENIVAAASKSLKYTA